jgi:hypothetical protein
VRKGDWIPAIQRTMVDKQKSAGRRSQFDLTREPSQHVQRRIQVILKSKRNIGGSRLGGAGGDSPAQKLAAPGLLLRALSKRGAIFGLSCGAGEESRRPVRWREEEAPPLPQSQCQWRELRCGRRWVSGKSCCRCWYLSHVERGRCSSARSRGEGEMRLGSNREREFHKVERVAKLGSGEVEGRARPDCADATSNFFSFFSCLFPRLGSSPFPHFPGYESPLSHDLLACRLSYLEWIPRQRHLGQSLDGQHGPSGDIWGGGAMYAGYYYPRVGQ